ncbi:MAG: DUF4956 domain-containing protein [Acholeplasmatales bacterium]|nr:DUF4956 domain-containing protein [Acholeplasmatales bacterium]
MFDSIFDSSKFSTVQQFFLMAIVALITGFIYSWLISFRVKSTKRFFLVNSILPFLVGAILLFVNGNIGVGVAIGGAFALIRFRSAPGSSDEIASIFVTMAGGVAFGMGYLAYGAIILIGLALIYDGLTFLNIFEHKNYNEDKILKITIPESLDYTDVFKKTFDNYLKDFESVGVKTTGMGSMFKLYFKIKMKDGNQEKALIDELRTLNGNLEIQILPYSDDSGVL